MHFAKNPTSLVLPCSTPKESTCCLSLTLLLLGQDWVGKSWSDSPTGFCSSQADSQRPVVKPCSCCVPSSVAKSQQQTSKVEAAKDIFAGTAGEVQMLTHRNDWWEVQLMCLQRQFTCSLIIKYLSI